MGKATYSLQLPIQRAPTWTNKSVTQNPMQHKCKRDRNLPTAIGCSKWKESKYVSKTLTWKRNQSNSPKRMELTACLHPEFKEEIKQVSPIMFWIILWWWIWGRDTHALLHQKRPFKIPNQVSQSTNRHHFHTKVWRKQNSPPEEVGTNSFVSWYAEIKFKQVN